MPYTTDIRTFPDELFDIAKAIEQGLPSVTLTLPTHGQAVSKRQQFNIFRRVMLEQRETVFREIGKIRSTIEEGQEGTWLVVFRNTGSAENPLKQQIAAQLAAAGLTPAKGGDEHLGEQSAQQPPSEPDVKASIERFDQRLKELGFGGREGERN